MRPPFGQTFIFMCFAVTTASLVFAQDNKLSLDKEHMVGVIDAHIAGLESWRTGDVLIRLKEEGQGHYIQIPEGVVVEGPDAMTVRLKSENTQRFIFDFDNQRALVVNRGGYERQVFDALDKPVGEAEMRKNDRCLLFHKTEGIGLMGEPEGQIQRWNANQLPGFLQVLGWSGACNVQGLGMGGIGPMESWEDQLIQQSLARARELDAMQNVSHVGSDRYQVISRHNLMPDNSRFGFRQHVDWDVKRLVPVKFAIYSGFSQEDFPAVTKPQKTGTAEWTLIKGNYVPTTAKVSSTSNRSIYDRSFKITQETTIELYWFSINEELPDDLFDPKILRDQKQLDELLSEEVFENSRDAGSKK